MSNSKDGLPNRGPWTNDEFVVRDTDGNPVCTVYDKSGADIYLITAAPELLHAINELLEIDPMTWSWMEASVRAANLVGRISERRNSMR